MRYVPGDLQAHLESGVTTLARCWKVTRRDGAVYGFTDHDQPLDFDDVTFEPSAGLEATELESVTGLASDNTEVVGALNSASITESDLERGRFDDAEVDIYLVNWTDPEQRVLLFRGSIGETTRGPISFSAELRGLAHRLDQPMGRAFLRQCDAEPGDERCGISLTPAIATVTGVTADGEIETTLAEAGFARGLLTWTSGENAATTHPVRDQSGARLSFWAPPADPVAIGDTFEVTPGCDKSFATCRDSFGNHENFRGFPHMPGDDYAASYPNRGEGNDGSSI